MAGLAVTFLIMALGVSKGIEKMNKIMMPLFFVFFLFLMVRVLTLGNVGEGINISLCQNGNTSRSPKPGCLPLGRHSFPCLWQVRARLVYGSYLSKDVDVVGSARNVAFFDTCAAILAGLVVIPAVFAFGLDVPRDRRSCSLHCRRCSGRCHLERCPQWYFLWLYCLRL